VLAVPWWSSAPTLVRLATFNIEMFPHGGTALVRVAEALAEADADIVAVQEIRSAAALSVTLAVASAHTDRRWTAVLAECVGEIGLATGLVYDAARWRPVVVREYPELLPIDPRRPRCPTTELSGMFAVFDDGDVRLGVLSVHFRPFPSGFAQRQVQWRRALSIARDIEAEFGVPVAVLGDTNSTGWFATQPSAERTFIHAVTAEFGFAIATTKVPCSEYWRPGGEGDYHPSMLDHVATRGGAWSSAHVMGHCARMACGVTAPHAMDDAYFAVSDHCPVVVAGRLSSIR
jgi:endonuclease/exonuclease/phosphatase family metal-dependent hydrolase